MNELLIQAKLLNIIPQLKANRRKKDNNAFKMLFNIKVDEAFWGEADLWSN